MRITPGPVAAIVTFVLYLAVFYGIWILNEIDYDRIGESTETALAWYVAPLTGGAVLLVVAVTVLGWWRPVLFEAQRLRSPWWLWIAPAVMLAITAVFLLTEDVGDATTTFVLVVALGSLGVGFCEEVATRGVLLTGFRARLTEPTAWFLSTLLFGLLHLPNWWFGAGPAAAGQVALAFMTGSVLYLARRLSGSLFLAMALHGVWDFAAFVGDVPTAVGLLVVVNGVVGLVLTILLVRRERGRRTVLAGFAPRA
ncbi:hypothetical protein CLV56_4067 [Mumia flava]|uniref:CAAX prenyl protease 2/Lysostaphin resistance protein A-like domain-containing protein n=1 Tax=Mumia flava TaxID=1348852 RepID=A0A2M9AR66_9ACTN|nr:CPBP family intramembrane glutamic endopeptidase [Mumia flava]PJJ48191.1 hypothetical protein CLV56_4067 [Mumia flava]